MALAKVDTIEEASDQLRHRFTLRGLVIKEGPTGPPLPSRRRHSPPALQSDPPTDPTGAGDAVAAGFPRARRAAGETDDSVRLALGYAMVMASFAIQHSAEGTANRSPAQTSRRGWPRWPGRFSQPVTWHTGQSQGRYPAGRPHRAGCRRHPYAANNDLILGGGVAGAIAGAASGPSRRNSHGLARSILGARESPGGGQLKARLCRPRGEHALAARPSTESCAVHPAQPPSWRVSEGWVRSRFPQLARVSPTSH